MIEFKFRTEGARAIMEAIANNQPLPVPDGGWDEQNMMLAAAILHSGAFLSFVTALGKPYGQLNEYEREERERFEATILEDVNAAIEFQSLGMLPLLVAGECEAEVSGPMAAPWIDHVSTLKGIKSMEQAERHLEQAKRRLTHVIAQQPPSEN